MRAATPVTVSIYRLKNLCQRPFGGVFRAALDLAGPYAGPARCSRVLRRASIMLAANDWVFTALKNCRVQGSP